MSAAADKGEVLGEVEAVQAVYGDDCRVLRHFPPHIDVYIRPRTADDSSQQFVEAVLGIRAGAQYPDEPPFIILVESKGLDEKRQEHLATILRNKAQELSSCPMLVALCEEAVEVLSNMNHPEGNCPLCLYPLFHEDANRLPFMKLLSCFHCFHSECILRWWMWLQQQTEDNASNQFESIEPPLESQRGREDRREGDLAGGCLGNETDSSGMHISVRQRLGNCPVCRMAFHLKDIEHVFDLLETCKSNLSFEGTDTEDDQKLVLQSDAENNRRQKFEGLLNLQRENSGLIEPKKDLVVMPGMFLPEQAARPIVTPGNITEHSEDGESSSLPMVDSNGTSVKPAMNINKHSTVRRGRAHNPRKHMDAQFSRKQWNAQSSRKQWIKKENASDH